MKVSFTLFCAAQIQRLPTRISAIIVKMQAIPYRIVISNKNNPRYKWKRADACGADPGFSSLPPKALHLEGSIACLRFAGAKLQGKALGNETSTVAKR